MFSGDVGRDGAELIWSHRESKKSLFLLIHCPVLYINLHKTYAIHIVQYRNAGDDEIETF